MLAYGIQEAPEQLLAMLRQQVARYKKTVAGEHVGEEGKHRLCRVEATLDILKEQQINSVEIVLVIKDMLAFDNLNSRLYQQLERALRRVLECGDILITTSYPRQQRYYQQQDEKLEGILNRLRKSLSSERKSKLLGLNIEGITRGLKNYASDLETRNQSEGQKLTALAENLDALENKTVDNYRAKIKKHIGEKEKGQSSSNFSIFEKIVSHLFQALSNLLATPITTFTKNKNIHQIFYQKETAGELQRLERFAAPEEPSL